MQYFSSKGERLICQLCAHYCQLKPEQVGLCGVNKNTGKAIENLVYGYPVALHVDPIEKKPLYHFLPGSRSFSLGTVGCNFHCSFCQNWRISQEHEIDTQRYFSPKDIVALALENASQSIAYTYNEPTIFYPYAKDIATEAKKVGIKNVFVSNGFESSEVIEDMSGLIDAANIDLKSFDPHYYKKELGGSLEVVLENLKHLQKVGIWIEVTTLIVPSKNDSDEELGKIASFIAEELGRHVPWHISAFHPDYKERALPATSFESLQKAYDIGKKAGLHYVYIGNVGYENPTTCKHCGTLLIERKRFTLSQYHLKNGHCPQCDTLLEGVFDE
jgi:pyruvate formate lyase activating enzyme